MQKSNQIDPAAVLDSKVKNTFPPLNQEPVHFVDMTPDDNLAIRILQTYLQNCRCLYSDNSTEEPAGAIWKLMNEWQLQRAKILEAAIDVLKRNLSNPNIQNQ